MKDPQLSSPPFVHNISELSPPEPQPSLQISVDATVEDEKTCSLSLNG